LLLAAPSAAWAADTERTLTTIVGAGRQVGAPAQIDVEILEECVQSVPALVDLQPVTDARSEYVTHINGDPEHSGSVRKYSATIELTYVVYQRKLVIVTTNSVESTEPVLQEVGGRFDKSIRFTSNPENGDQYGGQQLARDYYFSTEEKAIDDAMKRAEAWLNQKRAVLCNP
jgi:hypothetical protein